MPLAHRHITYGGGDDRQQPQGAHQSQQRNQHKAAQCNPDNPAQGVERHHRTDIAPHPVRAHAQAHGQREGGAQQHSRDKYDAQRGHCETAAHTQQHTAAHRQGEGFGLGLQND